MKKLLVFVILFLPVFVIAQPRFASVKLGVFDPAATGAGFIIGYEGGFRTDRNFSIGWSIDWFNKNYVDENLVSQLNNSFGPNSSINEIRAKTNVHAFPIMGVATMRWPIAPRADAYITGGIGLETLLIFYSDYNNPGNNDFQGAFDFAWQIGTGVAFEIGPRSDLLLELDYHYSQPGWQYDATDPVTGRKETFERSYDMSGIMLRGGFRFYF